MGNPVNPEDITELEAQKAKEEEEKPPEWQDPEFLRDIEVFLHKFEICRFEEIS